MGVRPLLTPTNFVAAVKFLLVLLLAGGKQEYPVRLGSSEYAEQGCGRILCPACHDLERCQKAQTSTFSCPALTSRTFPKPACSQAHPAYTQPSSSATSFCSCSHGHHVQPGPTLVKWSIFLPSGCDQDVILCCGTACLSEVSNFIKHLTSPNLT